MMHILCTCNYLCNIIAVYIKYRDTARYAFGPIIQNHLNTFADEWNSHCIRKGMMAEAPGGIPNILYEYPQLHG